MPVVSGVPGVVDRRQGFAGQPYPPELVEALERQKEARGRVKHPAEIAAEKAESERRRDAERRAANPNPRQALRDAHIRHREAAAEVERLTGLQQRAWELVGELEGREVAALATLRERNAEAAQALVTAISNGADRAALPIGPKNDATAGQLAAVRAKLTVARDALHQVEDQLAAARGVLARADRDVRVAVYGLGVDYAVTEAEVIEGAGGCAQRPPRRSVAAQCGADDRGAVIGARRRVGAAAGGWAGDRRGG